MYECDSGKLHEIADKCGGLPGYLFCMANVQSKLVKQSLIKCVWLSYEISKVVSSEVQIIIISFDIFYMCEAS